MIGIVNAPLLGFSVVISEIEIFTNREEITQQKPPSHEKRMIFVKFQSHFWAQNRVWNLQASALLLSSLIMHIHSSKTDMQFNSDILYIW